MRTLYLSDLDGTLIRSDERISEYTVNIVNCFVEDGGRFSYATARSIVTASKVTAGLNTDFPVICCNGAFIIGNATREILLANYFAPQEADRIRRVLTKHRIFPIVYAYIDSKERFSFMERNVMRFFLDSRLNDARRREVQTKSELYQGDMFYFSCIGNEAELTPIKDIFDSDKCVHYKL